MKKFIIGSLIISGAMIFPAISFAFFAPVPYAGIPMWNQGIGFNSFGFGGFGFNPMGFGMNNVGISVQTPYGGGAVSFPVRGGMHQCGVGFVYGCTPVFNPQFGVQNTVFNGSYFPVRRW